MSNQVRADDLSSVPGTHMIESENSLPQLGLWPPHMCAFLIAWCSHVGKQMNKCKNNFKRFIIKDKLLALFKMKLHVFFLLSEQ